MLALVVEGLAGPECPHDFERFAQSAQPGLRLLGPDAERTELLGDRAPADAQLVAPSRCVIDGGGFTRQDGRVPEGVAEDQGTDTELSVWLASHVLVIIASNMGWLSARGGVR